MRRLIAVPLIAGLLLSFASVGAASAQEEQTATPFEQVVAYTQPSVVYLDVTWTGWVYDRYNKEYLNDGDPFVLYFSCTGFFVTDDGYIGTAGHCVDPANVRSDFLDVAAQWVVDNNYYVVTPSLSTARQWAEEDYRIEGEDKGTGNAWTKSPDLTLDARWSTSSTEPLYTSDGDLTGTSYGARVIEFLPWNDGAGDVALIKVDAVDTPALAVAGAEAVTTGTDVVSIGYPADVGSVSDATLSDPSFKEGSISSVRTNALYPVYETSASLSGGMSGGPTVNFEGEVVGINSYGISGNDHEFNFVQASTTLLEVMTSAGIDPAVGEPGTTYAAGLDALYAEDKGAAVENLTVAAEDIEMAEVYLEEAEALPDPKPVVSIAIGAVVLLLGLVGLFLFIRSRKDRGPAEITYVTPLEPGVPEPPVAVEHETPQTITEVLADHGKFCSNCGARDPGTFCRECGTKQ